MEPRGPYLAQVCDVNRGLLSVRKVTKSGNKWFSTRTEATSRNNGHRRDHDAFTECGDDELVMWVKRKDF